MDRQLIYPGAVPLETDLLNAQKNDMIGLSKLAAAILGIATVVNGLACNPNGPAALNVVVSPGEIYSLQNIDGTAYSSIAADTTHQIMKQGILLDAVTLATAAPGTAGQSVVYLIQATYTDSDLLPVVLPYYNATNPAIAYSGPANAGTTNNTVRKGVLTVSAKAGIAAATGSQTTPAPDAGNVGLFAVTVANGQATVVAGNIVQLATAPFTTTIPGLIASIQGGGSIVGTTGGAADALTGTFVPTIAASVNGASLFIRAITANLTTTPTFTPNSGVITAATIVKGNNLPLAAGDIAGAGHWLELQWDSVLTKWVLQNPATGVAAVATVLPAGVTSGFVLSPNGATLGIAAGRVTDNTGTASITLAAAISKGTGAFVVGTGNGGKSQTGAIANNTWYHVYSIRRPDTNVVDTCFSTNASGLLAADFVAGGGNVPDAYTRFPPKPIMSVLTNGAGQFLKYTQVGNKVTWDTPVNDLSTLNPGSTGAAVLKAMSSPLGLKCEVIFAAVASNNSANTSIIFSDPANADVAPSSLTAQVSLSSASQYSTGTVVSVFTDLLSRIRYRADVAGASNLLNLNTTGFVYLRGTDA